MLAQVYYEQDFQNAIRKFLKEKTYTCKWLFTLNIVNKFVSINSNIAFGVASVIMMGEWMSKKIQYLHDTKFFSLF